MTILGLVEKLDQVCNSQWLLIIDDIHTQVPGVLGSQGLASLPIRHGSILWTTRDYVTSHPAENRFIFSLDTMTASEATQMLESQVDITLLTSDRSFELVEYLEHHPAFIARVAGSMRFRSISATRYLQLLQELEQYCSTLYVSPDYVISMSQPCAVLPRCFAEFEFISLTPNYYNQFRANAFHGPLLGFPRD